MQTWAIGLPKLKGTGFDFIVLTSVSGISPDLHWYKKEGNQAHDLYKQFI